MSTIGEEGTERCAELASEHELEFVDAPVLGTKQPAEEGKLVILASGPERARDRLAPVLDAIGQRTMWVGGAGDGTKLKLATNAWLLAIVEGAAETLALAEGMGIDPQLVLDAVDGGPLDMPYLKLKGKAMLATRVRAVVHAQAGQQGRRPGGGGGPGPRPRPAGASGRFAGGWRRPYSKHGDEDLSATFLTSAPAGAAA